MRILTSALALIFVVACGGNFNVRKHTFTPNDWGTKRVQVADKLQKRGWTIAGDDPFDVTTEWRFLRHYPGDYGETWFGLRVRIRIDDGGTVYADCMQKEYGEVKARMGVKETVWVPCKDELVINLVNNTAEDIARLLDN